MTERSMFWDGIALGDCGPYTTAHVQDRFFRMLFNGTGNRGPVHGWRDELEVSGAASPITVATGGAIVYGGVFDSDVAATVNIPTPAVGLSRYDRIVVRRDWATYTTRIARRAGLPAAVPAVPALVQTVNVTWEIPLATILVDDAGTLTLTDAREFCTFSTDWPANAVTTAKYAPGAVTIAKVPDRTRYQLKGSGQIEPDSTTPCTWVAGASYDYWQFADAATNSGWVYFMGPTGLVGASVDIYVWSVPDVNGAGIGVENCQWDYNTYSGPSGGTLANTSATVNVDQQARINTTVYADQLIAGFVINAGDILILKLDRAGAADSYNSAMRLLGVEMRYTADA
jgi:hypothetical protein